MTFLGFDLSLALKAVGYLGLFGIALADSGLLIGLFLPGDSMLFTAGFLASQGYFEIVYVIIICFLGAALGDSIGYTLGKRFGPRIFNKNNSLFFHKDHIERARNFYKVHGGKTIVLARFIHGMRTIAPILAGVARMPYRSFLVYNLFGGGLWVVSFSLLGFYVGNAIPYAERYLLLIVALIALGSFSPTIIKFIRYKFSSPEVAQVADHTKNAYTGKKSNE